MQTTYETLSEATIAAHHVAEKQGYAFAVQWPQGNCTVETRKPSLRNQGMKVVCCEDGRETLA